MDESVEYEFIVLSQTPADANRLAASLKQRIMETDEEIEVYRKEKADQTTQDIGSVLIALVSAPLAAELAKGIFGWLNANRRASLTIKRKDGVEITVSNVNAETVSEIFKSSRD